MIKISVIIPVYNSPHGISDTLNSIIDQKEFDSRQLEVVVVDNNSSDNTYDVAAGFENKFEQYLLLKQPVQGSYAARNMGIENASGDLFCFIDADVILEELFFKKLINEYQNTPFDYAGVNVLIKRTSNSFASQYDALKAFDIEDSIIHGHFTPTITLIVVPDIFRKIGLFDAGLESGGDVIFGKKVFENNFRQIYLNKLQIFHPARETFKELRKKAKRVARGYAQHMLHYPDYFHHERNYFQRIGFYLPNNPIMLYEKSKKRDLDISFLKCFLLSFFAVPLAFIQRKEFYKYYKGNI